MKNDVMLKIDGIRNTLVGEIAQAVTRAQNNLPEGAVIEGVYISMLECATYRDRANGAPPQTVLGAVEVIVRV